MTFKCKIGLHSWNGCKCSDCGKECDHVWSKDCEKCSKCGTTRENGHDWTQNCEKCSKCGKTRENEPSFKDNYGNWHKGVIHHAWLNDCEKCSKCGKTREMQHDWSKDCEKCSKCGKIIENRHDWAGCKCNKCGKNRDEQHEWSKDCEKCSKCGKIRENQHIWDGCKCSECGLIRDEQHIGELDCSTCSRCGKEKHHIEEYICLNCKKTFDLDGNAYHTIRNGFSDEPDCYEWLAENLNVSCFRNGDIIDEVRSDEDWERYGNDHKPAWCYYNNDPENGKRYGKLYNWFAVNDPRGLAPKGWHIPCLELTFFGKIEKEIYSIFQGLSILFAGERRVGESFVGLGECASFWTDRPSQIKGMANFNVFYNGKLETWEGHRANGLSVRCIRHTKPDDISGLGTHERKLLNGYIKNYLPFHNSNQEKDEWQRFLEKLEKNGFSVNDLKDKGFLKFSDSQLLEYVNKCKQTGLFIGGFI